MPTNLSEITTTYLHKVMSANKEATMKEAFKDLLNRIHSVEKEIDLIIDKISNGAKVMILNNPKEDKLSGS